MAGLVEVEGATKPKSRAHPQFPEYGNHPPNPKVSDLDDATAVVAQIMEQELKEIAVRLEYREDPVARRRAGSESRLDLLASERAPAKIQAYRPPPFPSVSKVATW